jgi:hypothetical protein
LESLDRKDEIVDEIKFYTDKISMRKKGGGGSRTGMGTNHSNFLVYGIFSIGNSIRIKIRKFWPDPNLKKSTDFDTDTVPVLPIMIPQFIHFIFLN